MGGTDELRPVYVAVILNVIGRDDAWPSPRQVSGPSHAQMRLEMRPVETITLSTQQFLTGDKNGKPAVLAGELRIPKPGTDNSQP